MKHLRKIIIFTLIMGILLSALPLAHARAFGLENFTKQYRYIPFSDVSSSAWYAEDVQYAYELGLVKGTTETTFSPNATLTIAEALALASRLHNIYYGETASLEQGNPWYQVYVDYAINNEIILSDQYTNYMDTATRADFAVIFANALPEDALEEINDIESGDLPDVPDNAPYAGAVYKLYNAGILTGNDIYGTFKPRSSILRSEVAAIVTRMAVETERIAFTPENTSEDRVIERVQNTNDRYDDRDDDDRYEDDLDEDDRYEDERDEDRYEEDLDEDDRYDDELDDDRYEDDLDEDDRYDAELDDDERDEDDNTDNSDTNTSTSLIGAKECELLAKYFNLGISNISDATSCLSSYIKTQRDSYKSYYFQYIRLAYEAFTQALNISEDYDDSRRFSKDIEYCVDLCEDMLTGSYAVFERADMIETMIPYFESVLDGLKEITYSHLT